MLATPLSKEERKNVSARELPVEMAGRIIDKVLSYVGEVQEEEQGKEGKEAKSKKRKQG